ncbi:MAG TPA: recombinase family protein [Candidatus Baltobacteraceae bacterium]
MKQVVSYIRVSTQRQGTSGLGLEAQRAAVEQFCTQHGYQLLSEFQEVESGRKSDRPILRQALAYAKAKKAVLLIAKLDRLARNVAFIANLMEAGVEFRACDLPEASKFILHVMAAVAEQEARAISDRTRAALQAAKARGVRLGAANPACRNLNVDAGQRGAARTAKLARDSYVDVLPLVQELRAKGLSLQAIGAELDARGIFTRNGRSWNPMQVARVLRYAA